MSNFNVGGTNANVNAEQLNFSDGTVQTTAAISGGQGPQGVQGPVGETGATGPQGAPGTGTQLVAEFDALNQAAIASGTLYTPAVAGLYLISIYFIVTKPASGGGSPSSSLGGTNGFRLTWTDADTNVSQTTTIGLNNFDGTIKTTASGNNTNTMLMGQTTISVAANTPITFTLGYSSSGTNAMEYALHLKTVSLS